MKQVLFRSVAVLSLLVLLCSQQVAAFTSSDISSIQNNTPFYDPNACTSSGPATAATQAITVNNTAAQQAAQQASTNGTNVGYALYDSSGNLLANYNDTFENYGASITKSMILVAYLDQVGSGSISSANQALLTGMIENSSDPNANSVFNLLSNPEAQIKNVAQKAGMTGFKYNDQGDSVYYLGQSQITANDFAKFFSKIDTMFPATQKSFALNLLSNITPNAGLLQAGLPGTVYSKEGWKPEPGTVDDSARSGSPDPFGMEGAPYIVNQAAQFSSGGTTYGVAVTVSGTANEPSGEAIIKQVVSSLVQQSASAGQTSASSCCSGSTTQISGGTLPSIIPEPYNGAFTQGANKHNVAPALIAAIFTEENFTDTQPSQLAQTWADFPKQHPDPNSGWPTNQYHTEGAFQFIPTTWTAYGEGGDPQNILDAATAAANYLAANGATTNKPPSSWSAAIFQYNHADWYVAAVMAYYNFYNGGATNPTVNTAPPAAAASGCSAVSASCNGPPAGTTGLSSTRQEIVCIAQEELTLWQSGQLKPGTNAYFKYSDNRSEEWCADFVSWVYNHTATPLGPAGAASTSASWDVPFVGNLTVPPQDGSKFTFHDLSKKPGYKPVPGDLAIHGTQHVNIVVGVQGSTITLIGGDQGGNNYPDNIVSQYSITDPAGDSPAITGYLSPNN